MYRLSSFTNSSYINNYKMKNKSNVKFHNIVQNQNVDSTEKYLKDEKKNSPNKNLTDEEFRELLKTNLYVITEGKIFSEEESKKVGAIAVWTGEDVKRDHEFLMSGPNTFPSEWFDKDGNLIDGIAFKNKKANRYDNLKLSGHNSKVGFNELMVVEGSKVDLGNGYSIQIHDDRLLYCYKDITIRLEDMTPGGGHHSYLKEVGMEFSNFLNMLRHHANGDITSMWLNQPSFIGSRKHFLENMGIDTTKPFTINGTEFKYVSHNDGTGSVRQIIN